MGDDAATAERIGSIDRPSLDEYVASDIEDPQNSRRFAIDRLKHDVAYKIYGDFDTSVERLARTSDILTQLFQTAAADLSPAWAALPLMERSIPGSGKRSAIRLTKETLAVIEQKGFRWSGACMCPAEHDRIGSTVNALFRERDPLVPVVLTRQQLVDEGVLQGDS